MLHQSRRTRPRGKQRVTLEDGVATLAARAESGEFKDWRSGAVTHADDGSLTITYVCKRKGGTVVYSITPDFDGGTFAGSVDYEE